MGSVMVVRRASEIQTVAVNMPGADSVVKQVAIGIAEGTPNFSMRVITVEKGGHTPFHAHPFEHVNYVLSGTGAIVTNSGETPLKQSDSVLVIPNEEHQYRNSGDAPFVFICVVAKEYE